MQVLRVSRVERLQKKTEQGNKKQGVYKSKFLRQRGISWGTTIHFVRLDRKGARAHRDFPWRPPAHMILRCYAVILLLEVRVYTRASQKATIALLHVLCCWNPCGGALGGTCCCPCIGMCPGSARTQDAKASPMMAVRGAACTTLAALSLSPSPPSAPPLIPIGCQARGNVPGTASGAACSKAWRLDGAPPSLPLGVNLGGSGFLGRWTYEPSSFVTTSDFDRA